MLTFPRQALALNASMLRQERDAAQRRVANLLDQLSEVEMGSEAVVAAKDREIATLTETLNVWCCDVSCLGSSFALPLCLCLGWRFKVGLLDRQPFREHARVTHVTLLCFNTTKTNLLPHPSLAGHDCQVQRQDVDAPAAAGGHQDDAGGRAGGGAGPRGRPR